jgi:hypothetical protein
MSFFVASTEASTSYPDSAPRFTAWAIHVDQKRHSVWFWVPELSTLQRPTDQIKLYVWNQLKDAKTPLNFSSVDERFRYSGLVQVEVSKETLSAQRSSLMTEEIEPAPWPNTAKTLQDVIDEINPSQDPNEALRVAKGVVLHLITKYDRLNSLTSLQDWLASIAIPKVNVEIATSVGFEEFMRSRPHLFKELAGLVPERRIVLLLGSRQSYIKEFLEGFQEYIQTKCCERCERLTHVTARFNPSDFQKIFDKSALRPRLYRMLDCLLASLALAAVKGLKSITGAFLSDIYTADMVDDPVEFASVYFGRAKQPASYWECVDNFLGFLSAATMKAGLTGKITIFLPFETLEEIINGNDVSHRELWEGLGALRLQLNKDPDTCPELGLIVAANYHPIDVMIGQSVKFAVLRIPPLSQVELGRLLNLFWGIAPTTEELNLIDKNSGGDPWFVFLTLRCLRAVVESRADLAAPERRLEAITEACTFAHSAVRGDLMPLPHNINEDVDIYLKDCGNILQEYRSTPGAIKVLGAWKSPNESYYSRIEEIRQLAPTWIRMGLVFVQAVGQSRGSSLAALSKYPSYQLCPAGDLPYAFAQRLLRTVVGREQ